MPTDLLYETVAEAIRSQIRDGQLQPDQKAPSIASLRDAFSVSTITASRALRELALKGFLKKVPGRGYFISQATLPPVRQNLCVGCLLRGNFVSLDDHYFNEIICGIQQTAGLAKVDLLWSPLSQLLCQPPIRLEDEFVAAALELNDRVNGFLLDERIPDHIIRQILDLTHKPAVVVNRPTALPIASVSPDYRQGLLALRKTLLQMQYNRFIFAVSDMNTYAAQEKMRVFQELNDIYGMQPEHCQFLTGITSNPIDITYQRLQQCRKNLAPGKTVLISSTDGCLKELLDHLLQDGVPIPQDLGLVGTDGLSLAFLNTPRITTLKTDTVQLGQKAMMALLSQLDNQAISPIQNHLLTQTFVLGDTI